MEVFELLHNADIPPETCQKIPNAISAIKAVSRQYSDKSCPSVLRSNLARTFITISVPIVSLGLFLTPGLPLFSYKVFPLCWLILNGI